jgi:glutamyl-tRNA synthetase
MATGRFAPSPTGRLHLGNLRTALVAWLFARSAGSSFLLRMEDLDAGAVREEHYRSQPEDLTALGLDWDGEVVRQSERRARYDDALHRLVAAGLTYPCWCSRREIREAVSAPHGDAPGGAYPGTCRDRDPATAPVDRPPALRLRAAGERVRVVDRLVGPYEGAVDDIVLRRNDGTPAYHLAVVVDDAEQGVREVVRADDLLPSTPSQIHLGRLLGLDPPAYAHVPLVLAPDGARLAKRHGAVTLEDRRARGESATDVVSMLAASLGLVEPGEQVTARDLVGRFDPDVLPRSPWLLPADTL